MQNRLPSVSAGTTTMSRPILRRLGFEPVASTTTYVWDPDRQL
jgi:hypothetical protein